MTGNWRGGCLKQERDLFLLKMRSRGRQFATKEQPGKRAPEPWLSLCFPIVILRVWFFSSWQLELEQCACVPGRQCWGARACYLLKRLRMESFCFSKGCVHVHVQVDFQKVLSFHYRYQGLSSVFHSEHFCLLTLLPVQKKILILCGCVFWVPGLCRVGEERREYWRVSSNYWTCLCWGSLLLLSLVCDVWNGSHVYVLHVEGVFLFMMVLAYLLGR